MFYAAAKGKVDFVRKMLERGADPNLQDNVRKRQRNIFKNKCHLIM